MRRCQRVTSGSIAALLAASGALAQPATPVQDRTRPAQPDAARMDPFTGSEADQRTLFDGMAGVWRVDVVINPTRWLARDPRAPRSPAQRAEDDAAAIAARNAGSPATGAWLAPGAMGDFTLQGYCEKRWVMGGTILEENLVLPDLGTDMGVALSGVDADGRKAAPNGSTGASQPGNRAPAGAQPTDPARRMIDTEPSERMFQGVSFMAYDGDAGAFELVCMNNRRGDIQHATGALDTANRQIVLIGCGHHGGDMCQMDDPSERAMLDGRERGAGGADSSGDDAPGHVMDPNRGVTGDNLNQDRAGHPSPTPPTQPGVVATNPRLDPATGQPYTAEQVARYEQQRATNAANNPDQPTRTEPRMLNESAQHVGANNLRVVIEILGPNQHRITAYATDATSISGGDSRMVPPTANDASTPASTPPTVGRHLGQAQPSDPRQPADGEHAPWRSDPSFNSPMGTVIYQATYTRVDGAEASRYRQYIERASRLSEAGTGVDDDR